MKAETHDFRKKSYAIKYSLKDIINDLKRGILGCNIQ